jgi:hypothetical protein
VEIKRCPHGSSDGFLEIEFGPKNTFPVLLAHSDFNFEKYFLDIAWQLC